MVGKIGVLALQGAFAKHEEMLHRIGIDTQQVRYAHQLSLCNALIIPGGESTVMQQQIQKQGLLEPIKQFGSTHPLFGTCAGMILMAQLGILNLMDISVNRNAYGSQCASFTTQLIVSFAPQPIEALFIRAPCITAIHSPQVTILASLEGVPVLVQQGLHLAAAFHPELTNDPTIHQYFINLCLLLKQSHPQQLKTIPTRSFQTT